MCPFCSQVFYRTSAFWDRCHALTAILHLLTQSEDASSTAANGCVSTQRHKHAIAALRRNALVCNSCMICYSLPLPSRKWLEWPCFRSFFSLGSFESQPFLYKDLFSNLQIISTFILWELFLFINLKCSFLWIEFLFISSLCAVSLPRPSSSYHFFFHFCFFPCKERWKFKIGFSHSA